MITNPALPPLVVRAVRCVGVELPMTYALGTSRGTLTKAPLLLVDLETDAGITGRSYIWSYFPAAMVAIAKLMEEVERSPRALRWLRSNYGAGWPSVSR
jgi:mandelate racemase